MASTVILHFEDTRSCASASMLPSVSICMSARVLVRCAERETYERTPYFEQPMHFGSERVSRALRLINRGCDYATNNRLGRNRRSITEYISLIVETPLITVSTVGFSAIAVTSSTVPSSSSTSTAVLGGGAAGLPPQPPPIVYRGGDRFYPGGSFHHHHDHHQQGTATPTLSHVPPPAIYPVHPHQPQLPVHNGPPSSITPPKTSISQKKKNSTYRTSARFHLRPSVRLASVRPK